ncbi:MAG: hypothetical protein C0609_09985 [Deltaproteobacteria bacterium]|nr:MAG: hypothetical protein C0609_09985 [Deltaproteobacteria bacterium]
MLRAVSLLFVTSLLISGCASTPAGKMSAEVQPNPEVTISEGVNSLNTNRVAAKSVGEWGAMKRRFIRVGDHPDPFGEYAGPIVIEGKVYVGNSDGRFLALERESGKVIWEVNFKGGIYATPAYYGGLLYISDDTGEVAAIDLLGKKAWSFKHSAPVVSSMIAEGGVLYLVGADQQLFALESASGSPVWQFSRKPGKGNHIWRSQKIALEGDTIYAGFNDGYLLALDARAGAVKWRARVSEEELILDITAGPVIGDDAVYVASENGVVAAYSKSDGEELWHAAGGAANGFALGGGYLYFSKLTGEVEALDAATGELKWRTMVNEGAVGGTPTLAGEEVIVAMSRGSVWGLDAATGKVRRSSHIGSGAAAPIWVDEGGMVIHSHAGAVNFVDFRAP